MGHRPIINATVGDVHGTETTSSSSGGFWEHQTPAGVEALTIINVDAGPEAEE